MLEISSEQYKYLIVHVHLAGKLNIHLLYESAQNIKVRDKITESSTPPLQYEIVPGWTSRGSD
jgi:hypothetical protein